MNNVVTFPTNKELGFPRWNVRISWTSLDFVVTTKDIEVDEFEEIDAYIEREFDWNTHPNIKIEMFYNYVGGIPDGLRNNRH